MDFSRLFDTYSRQARLTPALFVLLPALASIAIWLPDIYTLTVGLVSLLTTCGALIFLANVARYQGRRIQKRLYKKWSGEPSTRFLRHRDQTLDENTKARYHGFLSTSIDGVMLPSPEEELANPEGADRKYESAVKWLLEKTRDTNRFDLLFKENVAYGFRRNLLGLKPIGVPIAILSVLGNFVGLAVFHNATGTWLNVLGISSLIFCVLVAAGWAFIVNEEWVHDAGDSYAVRLLASCDQLAS